MVIDVKRILKLRPRFGICYYLFMGEEKDDGAQLITGLDVPKAQVVTISLEERDSKEIVKKMTEAGIVDITDGFPARDKQQMWDIIWDLFYEKEISRIPIIGVGQTTAEGANVKVYMFCHPGQKIQHWTLWEELGSPKNVSFTTSIEGWIDDPPSTMAYLKLPDVTIEEYQEPRHTLYLPFGQGSDVAAFYRAHPLSKQFTRAGREIVKNIFDIEGVEAYGL